jgi:hypothetical protein
MSLASSTTGSPSARSPNGFPPLADGGMYSSGSSLRIRASTPVETVAGKFCSETCRPPRP